MKKSISDALDNLVKGHADWVSNAHAEVETREHDITLIEELLLKMSGTQEQKIKTLGHFYATLGEFLKEFRE